MNEETLADTSRLAYTNPYEAQRPSRSGPWTQGWPCSDEKDDSRTEDQTWSTSGQCTLEEGERKERVTRIRRPYLTRSSFQKG
jgi:hypothetical protein